jgi:hypothetical protein
MTARSFSLSRATSAAISLPLFGIKGWQFLILIKGSARGPEVLLDTARFWASRAVAESDGKRHIRHVIGPDEYHEDVDDNAFTNVMARWNIARALETMDLLRARHAAALREKLALGDDEFGDWRDAIARIVTGLDAATASMSSSPVSTRWNRSTSPPTPNAPCPSTWSSAASGRRARRW